MIGTDKEKKIMRRKIEKNRKKLLKAAVKTDNWAKKNRGILLQKSAVFEKVVLFFLKSNNIKAIPQYPTFYKDKKYFLDIYLPEYKIGIEVDGDYHFTAEQHEKDESRTIVLKQMGIKILRIKNKEVASGIGLKTLLNQIRNA